MATTVGAMVGNLSGQATISKDPGNNISTDSRGDLYVPPYVVDTTKFGTYADLAGKTPTASMPSTPTGFVASNVKIPDPTSRVHH